MTTSPLRTILVTAAILAATIGPSAVSSAQAAPTGTTVAVVGSPAVTPIAEPVTTTAGPTTTARMTIDANSVTEEGSPTNATGRIVFLVACAVIVVGALVVFLSARRRKATS